MLELTRSGPGRRGVSAWVEGEPVEFLSSGRSEMIPVRAGRLYVEYVVTLASDLYWELFVSHPETVDASAANEGSDDGYLTVDIP